MKFTCVHANYLLYVVLGVLCVLSSTSASSSAPVTLRVVTWNVADNKKMTNGYTDVAIDKVLGLDGDKVKPPSIYAIGLEENCWMCNKGNLGKIGQRFLSRINRKAANKYAVVSIVGTRMSITCQAGCSLPAGLSTHGTTALLIIAKISLEAIPFSFQHNAGCHSSLIQNAEKGIAAMKVTIKGGKTLCFGAAHLDSEYTSYRRQCFKNFFDASNSNKAIRWSTTCDAQFMFGDFNTRTGDKTKGTGEGVYVPTKTKFDSLKLKDELAGSNPYVGHGSGKEVGNLLQYINEIQPKTFKEDPFNFMPTYSIKAPADCNGQFPCYKSTRPKSWTDRIIYTFNKGKRLAYDAILEYYGDHFPVFAEFSLNP